VADWIRISRIAQVTPFLALGLFGVHAWVWSTFPGLGLTPAHFAPYLLAGACVAAGRLAPNDARKAERIAWTGAAGAILATGVNSPPGAWPTAAVALMAGASLLGLIWRARLRLCLPAVVSTLGGLYLLHGGASAAASVPSAAWLGTLALLLLGGAVADRDFRALFTSALAAGGAVAALEPRADLAPYGLIAGAVWLAGLGVWIFPDVRRWLPAVAVLGILGVGTILLHREPGVNAPWFAATALSAFGAGLAFQARPLQWTGLSGFVPFGIEMRSRWMPDTGGGWGLTLLAAGFLLLSAGVAFNLLAARKRKEEPARDGSGDG
jgi:hypothetical protein